MGTEVTARTVELFGRQITVHGHPDDLFFHSVCMSPDYDLHIARAALACLPAGGVVFDVGGNIGWFSLAIAALALDRGVDVDIRSFEPAQINLESFRRTIDANDDLAHLIHLYDFGLSSSDRSGQLEYTPANLGGAHLVERGSDHTAYEFEEIVSLRRLDANLLAELNVSQIDLMKIDIEGHEWELLSFAQPLIRHHKPTLLVEVNPWTIDVFGRRSTAEFVDYLCSLGPFVYAIDASGTYIDVQAKRMEFLRSNILARTHQDVLVIHDEDIANLARESMVVEQT